jgi:hypothetical protein
MHGLKVRRHEVRIADHYHRLSAMAAHTLFRRARNHSLNPREIRRQRLPARVLAALRHWQDKLT